MSVKKKVVAPAAPPKQFEERTIIVLKGLEFPESPLPELQTMMSKSKLTLKVDASGDSGEYFSKEQSVTFKIKVFRQKSDLKGQMEKPDLHVIYDGHARYGRGACFGNNTNPGEAWDQGTANTVDGLYRMGFGYVPIPLTDIVHHGYTYRPVSTSIPLNDAVQLKNERHPDIVNALANLHKTTLNQLIAQLKKNGKWHDILAESPTAEAALRSQLAAGKTPDTEIWYFDGLNFAEGHAAPQLPLHAGWKDTINNPQEMDKTALKCRVFCHFGCDSRHHFQKVVRQLKGWTHTGNEGYAYFTTSASYSELVAIWLYYLLTYNKYNAKQSWEPSLQYAVDKTNTKLRSLKRSYQVI